MSLTPDEQQRWNDIMGDLRSLALKFTADATARPNAWPRRFHLWRFWR